MASLRRLLTAAVATLFLAGACTSAAPAGPTIPPTTIPTIPPINIPTIAPIVLPSGIESPPVAIPSGSVHCSLVTSAEISQVWGSAMTDISHNATNCNFVGTNIESISVQLTTDTDLSTVKSGLDKPGQQVNVGGFPGIQGEFHGQAAVFIQKPTGQIQVIGSIVTGTDPATYTKLQQIGAIAVQGGP